MQHSKPARVALLCLVFVAHRVESQAQSLDHTAPLDLRGDLAAQMVEGIHLYLDGATAATVKSREEFWKRDYHSAERYESSMATNRQHLRRIIGAVEHRLPAMGTRIDTPNPQAPALANGDRYEVHAVRWPVFEGVEGEGLLLEPVSRPVARIVSIPNADWTPLASARDWFTRPEATSASARFLSRNSGLGSRHAARPVCAD